MNSFLRSLGDVAGVASGAVSGMRDDQIQAFKQKMVEDEAARQQQQLDLAKRSAQLAEDRDKRDALAQALQQRMGLRQARFRKDTGPIATGSPLDQPFAQIRQQQMAQGDTEKLGDEIWVAPLESDQQLKDRELAESRKYAEEQTAKAQAFTAQQNALTRAAQENREEWVSSGVDPKTGEPVLYNKRTGETKVGGGIKGGAGGGERSGMAAAFLGRLQIGKADFDNAMQFVKDYHDRLKTGKAEITPWMMSKASAANTTPSTEQHGAFGAASNALGGYISGWANKSLMSNQADYARYVNLLNAISTAVTEVMPRPNQALLGIEKGISTAKAGDTSERIDDIQHRLDKIYDTMFKDPQQLFNRGATTPPSAGSSMAGEKIPMDKFQMLSPESQDYFRRLGRAP